MKRLSTTTIFLRYSSRHLLLRTPPPPFINSVGETVVGITHFSTSSPDSSSSAAATSSSSYHSSSRRNPDDVRNVRVSVWWDFENCQVPCKVNVFKITQFITAAVRSVGIKGPIQITAFGDVLQLSRAKQEALSSTGVNLAHIPHGGKNSADRSLLVDLMYWVSQNPPPAHLFLISGDRDFASVLHRLRMNNYNILLASTENAPAVLCSAASIMWDWTSLVSGGNPSAKHFNQPPDGPYASWYGHYRVPLEDPFAVCNRTSYVQLEESSDSDEKPRPVPQAVVNVIRNILNSNPKGLVITELRAELGKSNVTLEKDLYGHKKFSRFLMAMPNLLKLQSQKDGQFIVHGVSPKTRDTHVPIPDTNSKDSVPVVDSKEDGAQNSCGVTPGEETLPSSSNETKLSTDSQQLGEKQDEPLQAEKQPSTVEKVKEGEVKHGQFYPLKISKPISEVGMLKSLWRKWFRGNNYGHQEKICHTGDQTVNEVARDAETGGKSAENVNESSGIFNRIVRWCKSWGSDNNTDKSNPELSKSDKEISSHSLMQEVLTESFWNELWAFLGTSRGSASILQSRTRQEMVQNLQKFGPSQLESLSEKQILQLVDLLISEKKWVLEIPSQTFPFRFVGPPRNSKPSDSTDSKTPLVKKNLSPKSRNDILRDCQKLVNEVVKQHPDGFNLSSFKKLFLEKYGYQLEVQHLGYQKLATLLQIMPGVKVESTCIFPSSAGPTIDKSPKLDNDTEWDELGPIAPIKTNKEDKDDEFETVSDNDLSDSDSEIPPTESQTESRKEGVSTLLQVLDSWYSNKEETNSNSSSRIASDVSDTNTDNLNNKKNPSLSYYDAGKHKPTRNYSFVADKPEDDKELFNGILASLKKPEKGSSESKMEG